MSSSYPNPWAVSAGTRLAESDPMKDPRVAAALEDYLTRMSAGQPPDREQFLAEHSEIADVLAECLDGLEFIQAAAPHLRSPDDLTSINSALPASTVLGDFRILREIGRGGMGVVYEAEQASLGRRVALKILPLAAALDPRRLQRFQLEAQTVALLHHDHIVPIYAVGTDRGVHFYAMQFIEGQTLAEVIDAFRHSSADLDERATEAGGPAVLSTDSWSWLAPGQVGSRPAATSKPGLDHVATTSLGIDDVPPASSREQPAFFRAVARLGQAAAQALEHAHGLGVLHRDIKPANLLIDTDSKLWLTDFGLARLQDEAGLTLTGDLLGTLRYMSPEQALAQPTLVDERSDVYSLGVTLYELLTLRPAFEGHDRQELLRKIAFDDAAAPRRYNPAIPLDLETIILKAMAKEPERRYRTAGELAADLNRFLNGQPVLARRLTPIEQLGRWSKRHKAVVTTAAVVLFIAALIGGGLLWREQRQTKAALVAAQTARARERQAFQMMVDAADMITLDAMAQVTAGSMEIAQKMDFYNKVVDYFTKLAKSVADDRDLQDVEARAWHRVGFAQMVMFKVKNDRSYLAPAETSLQKSIDLYNSVLNDHPERNDLREKLTEANSYLSLVRLVAHKPPAQPN